MKPFYHCHPKTFEKITDYRFEKGDRVIIVKFEGLLIPRNRELTPFTICTVVSDQVSDIVVVSFSPRDRPEKETTRFYSWRLRPIEIIEGLK